MTFDEVSTHTANGSVCVDIISTPQYSGFVRKVIFYPRNRVCIEFVGKDVGEDESGYEYCCTFSSLNEAIRSIEQFLDKPLSNWTNHTRSGTRPRIQEPTNIKTGHELLKGDIIRSRIPLPRIGVYTPRFDLNIFESPH